MLSHIGYKYTIPISLFRYLFENVFCSKPAVIIFILHRTCIFPFIYLVPPIADIGRLWHLGSELSKNMLYIPDNRNIYNYIFINAGWINISMYFKCVLRKCFTISSYPIIKTSTQ